MSHDGVRMRVCPPSEVCRGVWSDGEWEKSKTLKCPPHDEDIHLACLFERRGKKDSSA